MTGESKESTESGEKKDTGEQQSVGEIMLANQERQQARKEGETERSAYTEGKDEGKDEGKEGKEEKSSNVFIAATEEARSCMREATAFIHQLPETGEATVDSHTGESTLDVLSLLPQAKQHLSQLSKTIKHANRIIFQEHTIRTVQVPDLMTVLEEDGQVEIMLQRIKDKIQLSGEEFFHGITLFVPHDRGFSSDTYFDEDCWGTHIIRGPYQMRDLHDLSKVKGAGDLLCGDMVNNVSAGLNEVGEFVVGVHKVGHVQKWCRVERGDINVTHGTVAHFVDRVLFPPAY